MSEVSHFVHYPVGDLRRYVREILWVSSKLPRQQVLLPETALTFVLRQSGSASLQSEPLPHAVMSGLQPKVRLIEHGADSSLAIVRFAEVGASAFLGDRVDQLYSRTAPLDSLLRPQEIDNIQNVLADTPDAQQRFLALEGFLSARIHARERPASQDMFPQIEAAAEMIRRSEGRTAISAIARRTAMSQSALERHFRAAVGVTPKKLSRLARLQHLCRLWNAGKSFTEIAFEAGYCDQPHMVRDFRMFTGTSPEEFFRTSQILNLPIFYK